MDRYRKQIKYPNALKILWNKFHVKGWPLGVSTFSADWDAEAVSMIRDHLDRIQWPAVFVSDDEIVDDEKKQRMNPNFLLLTRFREQTGKKNAHTISWSKYNVRA